jgi:predicted Holliday junction resolvase-like endonuclease
MNPETLLKVTIAIVIIICCVLAYLYFRQKKQIPKMIENAIAAWREKELDNLRKEQRELAFKDSMIQLESWRQQELDLARKQQLETARNEMTVQFEQWKLSYTKEIRQDAIQKSQSTIAGKVTEHFIPYLPEFTYNPKDARFLGSPIDFIIFDGLDEGELRGVIFAEIKTNTSKLSKRERQLRDVIQAKKVEWVKIVTQIYLNSDNTDEDETPNIENGANETEDVGELHNDAG